MAVEPNAFMKTTERRVALTSEDKSILKSNAAWGLENAPTMADQFYA